MKLFINRCGAPKTHLDMYDIWLQKLKKIIKCRMYKM